MEYKSIPVNVNDVDTKQGIVTGYLSSFGTLDDGGDIVEFGAFKKSIQERGPNSSQPRIVHLYQHNPFYLLSKFQVLKEDNFGLYFESKIAPTSYGKDVLTLYEEKAITEHSIGYDTIKFTYKDLGNGKKARSLTELLLWEGSSVVWGMNSLTPTLGVKSVTELSDLSPITEQMERIEKILRRGNLQTDELCEALELQLKQWRSALKEYETKPPKREVIILETKGVVPFKDWPIHEDTSRAWDNAAADKRFRRWVSEKDPGEWTDAEWAKYRSGHLWYNSEEPNNLGSYKFLVVDVIDGEPKYIFKAAVASLGIVRGGRGTGQGADWWDDRDAIEAHIGKIYKKFGKELPGKEKSFKAVDFIEALQQEKQEQDLREMRWQIESAFFDSVDSVISDENLTVDEKISLISASFDQYKVAFVQWVTQILSLPKGNVGLHFQKAGRVLSARNRELVQNAINAMEEAQTALTTLLTAAEPVDTTLQGKEPSGNKGAEPGNHSDADVEEVKTILEELRKLRKTGGS